MVKIGISNLKSIKKFNDNQYKHKMTCLIKY